MSIRRIGIVGSGIMASQLAEFFLKKGYDTSLYAPSMERIQRAVERFKDNEAKSRLICLIDFKKLADVDIVIECVREDLGQKRKIFEELDAICPESTILASNTSTIPIIEICRNCRRKERILGVHFSNPAYLMKAVEVVKSDYTGNETANRVVNFIKSIGKEPVIVKDSPGFVLNRLLFAMLNEAAYMLESNLAAKGDIDKIMVLGANHPIGPFQIMDLIGIDTTVDILDNLHARLRHGRYKPCPLLIKMVEDKKLGRKNGIGFYAYGQ